MPDFIDSLREEIASLKLKLSKDSTYLKLGEAKRLLARYITDEDVRAAARSAELPVVNLPSETKRVLVNGKRSAFSFAGTAGAAAQASLRILQDRGPLTTVALLDELESLGISIGGKTPQNNLSSLLSKTAEVQAGPGRKGWQLAQVSGPKESADSDFPTGETLSADVETPSTSVEPDEEVAHEVDGLL